jgi:epoxyqueuosine reductase
MEMDSVDFEAAYGAELAKIRSVFRVVGIERIVEIRDEVAEAQRRHEQRDDYNYYADTAYDFGLLGNAGIQSVFVIATPSPFYVLRAEGFADLRIPPIYGNRGTILAGCKRATESVFSSFGYRSYPVTLPKKLVAVRCGLARYGNNGLSYINEYGSYFRLTMFASDYACEGGGDWRKASLMDSCGRCGKCVRSCPVGALEPGSVWVNTNRCLTGFNERPGPFPDWILPGYHRNLVGCTICQESCPQNRGKAEEVVIPVSPKTIRELLSVDDVSALSGGTRILLGSLDLDRYFQVLRRNILALIERET